MKAIFRYLISIVFPFLPETRCFGLKRWLLRRSGTRVGNNVRICSSARFIGSGQLEIGDNTWIGHCCLICTSSRISIGANCDIAPNVYIGNGTHWITPGCDRIANIVTSEDIIIGNGCWLCVNCTILPGVIIGNKCVVAAGAVVTTSHIHDFCLLVGIPAKEKKILV